MRQDEANGRILILHNYYRQTGGEDAVVAAERELLLGKGHQVSFYTKHNDAIADLSPVRLARLTFWNQEAHDEIAALCRRESIWLAHFHNTFPLISPAAYYAAKAQGVPVVQTLHNYRLLCANALLMRDGKVCEDCLGRSPWRGVLHRCYRDSFGATAVAAAMLCYHRWKRTYSQMVDVYIALTEFARRKFIEGGLPPEKIAVKPNFVHPDPGPGTGAGGFALFVGRLSPEKGLPTLLRAWERVGNRLPLKIAGDGPLAAQVQDAAKRNAALSWLGQVPSAQVMALLGEAAVLVFPSECYETFGRSIAEAFARGTPVIASRLGAMTEMVRHGETGLFFKSGDADDLAAQVELTLSHPSEIAAMRKACRAEFEAKYTAERNYKLLMEIYERAIAASRQR